MDTIQLSLTDVWVFDDHIDGHGSYTPETGLQQHRSVRINLDGLIAVMVNTKGSRTKERQLLSSVELLFPTVRLQLINIQRIEGLEQLKTRAQL